MTLKFDLLLFWFVCFISGSCFDFNHKMVLQFIKRRGGYNIGDIDEDLVTYFPDAVILK